MCRPFVVVTRAHRFRDVRRYRWFWEDNGESPGGRISPGEGPSRSPYHRTHEELARGRGPTRVLRSARSVASIRRPRWRPKPRGGPPRRDLSDRETSQAAAEALTVFFESNWPRSRNARAKTFAVSRSPRWSCNRNALPNTT